LSLDIAFLLGYPEISGGTNVILEHALGLTNRRHRVSIVTELPFDPRRLAWKPGAADLPLLCHADCRGHTFDLAIATWWRSVYDLPFVPARHYAYFCQSIESRFFPADQPDLQALAEYTYRQPLPIVTEASWIQRYLREHFGRDVTLVLNGVDKRIFRPDGPALEPRPTSGLRVLVEGALRVPFKRVELAVELCRQAGIDDLWLLTPTACDRYPGIRRVCSQVPMDRVGEVYRSCHVLVKLSTVEGMFGPPLEMMHCGGTAITTDVTGHEEYLRHGENGFVVRRGEEADVIRYLRMLQADRKTLDRLCAAALRTAETWPDWPQSVAGMDAFVRAVCERDPTVTRVQQDMCAQLRAALRLAGPLHAAWQPKYSGRQHLRMAWSLLGRKIRRRLGLKDNACATPAAPESVANVVVVPAPPAGLRLARRRRYRVCFIGNEARFALYAAPSGDRLTTVFCHVPPGDRDVPVDDVRRFGPEVTIVFEPERFRADGLAAMPGIVLGCCVATPDAAQLRALRVGFASSASSPRRLLHADPGAVTTLLHAGLAVAGPLVLPLDLSAVAVDEDGAAWAAREIPIVFAGPVNEATRPFAAALTALPGFVHVRDRLPDRVLRGILRRSRFAVHLPDRTAPALAAAQVARDMLCGCIVVGAPETGAYGLLATEHYLHAAEPATLVAVLRRALAQADDHDLIRRRAREQLIRFDAGPAWLRIIERHCVASGDPPEWDGRPAPVLEAIAP